MQLRKRLRKAQESIAQYKKYTSMLHAELGRFCVIGAAEDLDGQSEGVSHQHQRKGNTISALGRDEVKDSLLLGYSVSSVRGRSRGREK